MLVFFLSLWLFWGQAQSPTADERFNRAVELQRANQLDEAAREYRALLQLKPDYAEAYANFGAVLARLNQFDEAIAAYEKALKLNPNLIPIWMNLGIANFRAGRFAAARSSLTSFLALRPEVAQAQLLLGIVLVELGEDAEAIAKLEPLVSAGNNDVTALYSMGLALLRQKRPGALPLAERLQQLDGGEALAHLLRGQVLLAESNPQGALTELEQAVRLNAELPHLFYALGTAHLAQHQRALARQAFEKELQRRPQDFWSLYNLALIHEAEKRPEAARPLLEQALKQEPNSPEANALFGKLLVKAGNIKAALAPLELAVANAEAESETHYLLARVYQALGRKSEAEREFSLAQMQKVKQIDKEKLEGAQRP